MKIVKSVLSITLVVLALSACNTIVGVGKDLQGIGESLQGVGN